VKHDLNQALILNFDSSISFCAHMCNIEYVQHKSNCSAIQLHRWLLPYIPKIIPIIIGFSSLFVALPCIAGWSVLKSSMNLKFLVDFQRDFETVCAALFCTGSSHTGKSNPVMEFAQRSFPPEPKVQRQSEREREESFGMIYTPLISLPSKSNHHKERPPEFTSAAKSANLHDKGLLANFFQRRSALKTESIFISVSYSSLCSWRRESLLRQRALINI
jgi:hypothetical protein